MKVNSHNEWDTLKEIIVGNADARASLVFNNAEDLKEKDLTKKRLINLMILVFGVIERYLLTGFT